MDHKAKILSIGDNVNNQKKLLSALENDYQVTAVLSGESAIDLLERLAPEAILFDTDMVDVDCLKMCSAIRTSPHYRGTPIILLSNLNSTQESIKASGNGVDDYITKPVDIGKLRAKLQSLLTRKQRSDTQYTASNDGSAFNQNLHILHDFLIALPGLANSGQLGAALLQTFEKLNLKGAIVFHEAGEVHSTIGPLTDLENMLLRQATNSVPKEFSVRFVWGTERLGALIQNMPSAGSQGYQALTEILLILFKACDEKLNALADLNIQQLLRSSRPAFSNNRAHPRHLRIHREQLQQTLSELEHISEYKLAHLCHRLKHWELKGISHYEDRQELKEIHSMCVNARLEIYDQCLEAQSQLEKLLSELESQSQPA